MKTLVEIKEKYGDVPLYFSSYYKYSFSFRGTAPDGTELYAFYGGDAGDIYRFEVDPDKKYYIKDLEANYISGKKNNEETFSISDY
jgi:hypothetical protein